MAADKIEINVDHLRGGATHCGDAAYTARKGAEQLAVKRPEAGIFGDFAEAHDFHRQISAAQQGHVDQLHSHHRLLSDIGENGHAAGQQFLATDGSGGDSIRAAGSQIEGA